MKTISLITIVLSSIFPLLKAQTQPTKEVLIKFTNDYLNYYNNCNVDSMLELCTDDIEVYHDLAGLIDGKPELQIQSKKFCDWQATSNAPTVKAEIAEGIHIYELKNKDGKLYGAIVSGLLNFYSINKQTGASTKNSMADFTWILRLTGGDTWQIARDLSYNHQVISVKK